MIHAPTGLTVLGDRPYPVRGTADASLAVRRVAEQDFMCAQGVVMIPWHAVQYLLFLFPYDSYCDSLPLTHPL